MVRNGTETKQITLSIKSKLLISEYRGIWLGRRIFYLCIGSNLIPLPTRSTSTELQAIELPGQHGGALVSTVTWVPDCLVIHLSISAIQWTGDWQWFVPCLVCLQTKHFTYIWFTAKGSGHPDKNTFEPSYMYFTKKTSLDFYGLEGSD